MYFVYWIHLENHSDPYSEGYIGISKQPVQRFRTHLSYKSAFSKGVRQAIETYGKDTIKHTLLHEVNTLEEARGIENAYRPSTNIGWNIAKGGGVTPDCSGSTHSDETKLKISNGNRKAAADRGYLPSPFKGKQRHSDETKALIGSYHKGKTISEEHKKAISEKMSGANSPVSKSICMYHVSNPDKLFQFECIKDASVELGINYSTLRSSFRLGTKTPNRQGWVIKW